MNAKTFQIAVNFYYLTELDFSKIDFAHNNIDSGSTCNLEIVFFFVSFLSHNTNFNVSFSHHAP